jgi:hypothetical protein
LPKKSGVVILLITTAAARQTLPIDGIVEIDAPATRPAIWLKSRNGALDPG